MTSDELVVLWLFSGIAAVYLVVGGIWAICTYKDHRDKQPKRYKVVIEPVTLSGGFKKKVRVYRMSDDKEIGIRIARTDREARKKARQIIRKFHYEKPERYTYDVR